MISYVIAIIFWILLIITCSIEIINEMDVKEIIMLLAGITLAIGFYEIPKHNHREQIITVSEYNVTTNYTVTDKDTTIINYIIKYKE